MSTPAGILVIYVFKNKSLKRIIPRAYEHVFRVIEGTPSK